MEHRPDVARRTEVPPLGLWSPVGWDKPAEDGAAQPDAAITYDVPKS